MFIYVIVNSETLKIYVGQHKGPSLQWYLARKFYDANHHTSGTRSHLYAAMRRDRRELWSIHSLISGIETRKELDELEKHFIRVLKTQHPDVGYNICDGGEGFTGPHSEETKQKLRELRHSEETRHKRSESLLAYYAAGGQAGMKGKKHSAKWLAMQQEWLKDVHPTPESCEKLRQANLGKKKTPEQRQHASEIRKGTMVGVANPFFGRRHSTESKRKNAEAHRKPWSAARRAAYDRTAKPKIKPTPEETHRRQSDAAKRRFADPREREKQSIRLKGRPRGPCIKQDF